MGLALKAYTWMGAGGHEAPGVHRVALCTHLRSLGLPLTLHVAPSNPFEPHFLPCEMNQKEHCYSRVLAGPKQGIHEGTEARAEEMFNTCLLL